MSEFVWSYSPCIVGIGMILIAAGLARIADSIDKLYNNTEIFLRLLSAVLSTKGSKNNE
jgi:hypothetical protein